MSYFMRMRTCAARPYTHIHTEMFTLCVPRSDLGRQSNPNAFADDLDGYLIEKGATPNSIMRSLGARSCCICMYVCSAAYQCSNNAFDAHMFGIITHTRVARTPRWANTTVGVNSIKSAHAAALARRWRRPRCWRRWRRQAERVCAQASPSYSNFSG